MSSAETNQKTCTACGQTKPETDFYRRHRYKRGDTEVTGRRSKCKDCFKKTVFSYQRRNISEVRASILREQEGCCAICQTDVCSTNKKMAVDHDHTTGIVRGVLCSKCNILIGLANEDVATLMRAIQYLTVHEYVER